MRTRRRLMRTPRHLMRSPAPTATSVVPAAPVPLLEHPLAAVIFDMDGLMLDTEPLSHRAWFRVGEQLGLGIEQALLDRMIGRNFRDCESLIRQHLGSEAPVAAMMAEWHRFYDAELANGVPLKAGLTDLLDWLDAHNVARAVATSTRRERALRKLAAAGLLDRFAGIVAGDDVVRGKPAPDPFLAACALVGNHPGRCVVLEDSEPGIDGALAAGATAVMVPDLLAPSASIAARGVRILGSLDAVRDWLAASRVRQANGGRLDGVR